MKALNKQALIAKIKKQIESFDTVVLQEDEANALLDALEAAENNLIDSECHVAELEEALRDKQALLEALDNSLCETLPGTQYMDSPDGGNVTPLEQVRRMVADYRERIEELEAREVKPVAWMRNANVTSFMSRFTTDENYAVEQWGDDAVALYSLPVDFIPACFTDERNLMHINERGRETSLIWSERNSEDGDIKLFRAAGIGVKGGVR